MKITTNRPPAPFTPVSLTMTFESQAELDAMGKLFNLYFITQALGKAMGDERVEFHSAFKGLGADITDPAGVYYPLFRNESEFRACAKGAIS